MSISFPHRSIKNEDEKIKEKRLTTLKKIEMEFDFTRSFYWVQNEIKVSFMQ